MTGTWCTPEIQTAVRLGYTIIKVYEVYHWKETTKFDPESGEGGLFAKYINAFLKLKQEASGWPQWCRSEQDKQKYLRDYDEKEGIRLDYSNIRKNPGMRRLAKLMLNSFWGKFGQRLNMRQTQFFHETEVDKFFQMFSDPMKEAHNFHIIAHDTVQLEWIYKDDCVPEDNKTNIYVATFTTSWARLKLYSVLEAVGRRVLYYDTDSIIYVSRPGEYNPPLGDYLGELTDELKTDEHIKEFVSAGPKNYGYRTSKGEETCKIRGFTLQFRNSQLINFAAVKSLVTEPTEDASLSGGKRKRNSSTEHGDEESLTLSNTKQRTISVINPTKICRDKTGRKLFNRKEEKKYQMVYTKRRRLGNFDTIPYGY